MNSAGYLELLGIVQYRRRDLQVELQADLQAKAPLEKTKKPLQQKEPSQPGQITPETQKPALENLMTATDQSAVVNKSAFPNPAVPAETKTAVASTDKQMSDEHISFDLLIWKAGKLMVWEFSQGQAELAPAKHRLVNNVLMALWPSEFKGAQMFQQHWPIQGANASKSAAGNWLDSVLSGYLQQGNLPVWLMGDIGCELLLGQQDKAEELLGSRHRHAQLNTELLVGPSLQAMLENPIAKAQTWQMLRGLRNSESE